MFDLQDFRIGLCSSAAKTGEIWSAASIRPARISASVFSWSGIIRSLTASK